MITDCRLVVVQHAHGKGVTVDVPTDYTISCCWIIIRRFAPTCVATCNPCRTWGDVGEVCRSWMCWFAECLAARDITLMNECGRSYILNIVVDIVDTGGERSWEYGVCQILRYFLFPLLYLKLFAVTWYSQPRRIWHFIGWGGEGPSSTTTTSSPHESVPYKNIIMKITKP